MIRGSRCTKAARIPTTFDDDDPKIEVCESDGDEEGGSAATASRMPLLPTTVASDDGFDGCDRTRRERWRRRVRRAIAAAI